MAQLLGQKNKTLSGSLSIDMNHRDSVKKTWEVVYYVLGTTGDDEDDVLSVAGLPILYEPYRNGFCTNKNAEEITMVQGGALWEVSCKFASHMESEIPVVDISWDIEEKDEVLKFDAVTGRPILNSAREPIITERPISIPVLNISRIESSFSASRILLYNNKVNSSAFMGAPARCALMHGPTARKKIIQGQRYWEANYRIKFNMVINPMTGQPAGWDLYLLDHGTRYIKELIGDIPIWETIKNGEDKDDSTGNLNGQGGLLPEGSPEVYLPYNRYQYIDFSPLGLEG